MKRAYTKPKAKMVNFHYTERVVASGGTGTNGTRYSLDYCQQSISTCWRFYTSIPSTCREYPTPDNPGLPDGPTI